MTPNKQLIFETREEAREYFEVEFDKDDSNYFTRNGWFRDNAFKEWLSEQNGIIKNEVNKQ